MARCGCSNGGVVVEAAAGGFVTVEGVGTPDHAYRIGVASGGFLNIGDIADLAGLKQLARTPEMIAVGAITRNTAGLATSFAVLWPDGLTGTFTADTFSSVVTAIDSYHITYGSPVEKTFTQPAVTRDGSGNVTNLPDIVVT